VAGFFFAGEPMPCDSVAGATRDDRAAIGPTRSHQMPKAALPLASDKAGLAAGCSLQDFRADFANLPVA